jgi:hypothetical protein
MPMLQTQIDAEAGAATTVGLRPPFEAAPASASPELSDRPRRRTFTAQTKLRILTEIDGAADTGRIGAILRREGLSIDPEPPSLNSKPGCIKVVDTFRCPSCFTSMIAGIPRVYSNEARCHGDTLCIWLPLPHLQPVGKLAKPAQKRPWPPRTPNVEP